MSTGAVTQALQIQQNQLLQNEVLAGINLINLQIDPLPLLISTLVEHPPYPTEALSLALDSIGSGGWLLIRAGQVSTLTLTGLSGWRFDAAALGMEVRGPRIAISPSAAPLVYDFVEGFFDAYTTKVRFEPARYVHSILAVNRGPISGVTWRQGEDNDDHTAVHNSAPATAELVRINGKVDELQDVVLGQTFFPGEPAILIDNEAMGLALSTAEDRLLHRAPQTLTPGQSAVTPNLADTLNASTGDEITLNLMSQSDCVIFITGSLQRRRAAAGFTSEVPELLELSPWTGESRTAVPATSSDPQTTLLSGKVRKTGPARMGLTEDSTSGLQIVRAHPRLRLVQPFQPLASPAEQPITLSGIWLLIASPPEESGQLTVQCATWDARRGSAGEPLTRASVSLEPGLINYETGPDGLLAAWLPFDEAWILDPDQQTVLHALTISEIDGPVPLVEAPLGHPRLSTALFRDAGSAETLSERKFAGKNKALLFDLGREEEAASLTFTAGGVTQTIAAGPAFEAFETSLPQGDVTIEAEAGVEIEKLSAATSTVASG